MTDVPGVECIAKNGITYAYVVRGNYLPNQTTFVTPNDLKQQLGFIVYPAGSYIPRHRHFPVERKIVGTSEVIFVRQGRCEAELYDDGQQLVSAVELKQHDTIVLVAGGHGFKIYEDTILMEVKQGPFTGQPEKERF
jgi:cupin fold WbuC family metalloprotein